MRGGDERIGCLRDPDKRSRYLADTKSEKKKSFHSKPAASFETKEIPLGCFVF